MKTILLATDGSPSAQKATETAIELASAMGAKLHVVAVWRVPVYEYGYVPVAYAREIGEAQHAGAESVAAHAVDAATTAGVAATSELREGDPADEICSAAEDAEADMIVVGAHGWRAMQRLFFGSVSTSVLRHAACPVLVVRAEPAERHLQTAGAENAASGA